MISEISKFLKYKVFKFFNPSSSFSTINAFLIRSFDTPDRFRFFWRTEAFHRGARNSLYRPLRSSNFNSGSNNFNDIYPYAWQDFVYDPTEFIENRHFFLNVPFFYNAIQLEQSHHLMFERKNKKWGVEVGVRYVPSHLNYLDALRLKGLEIINSPIYLLENHRFGSLTWPMMMDIILLGGPEKFLDKSFELYKYWLHTEDNHMQLYEKEKMTTDVYNFWNSSSRKYFEDVLKNWSAYAMSNRKDLNRWAKWQKVAELRSEISRGILYRFGFYRTVISFLVDLRSGFFKQKS